jgi:hypothetical protein
MKSLFLAAALVGCIVACNTTDKKSVSDPAAPNAPKAECSAEKGSCSDMKGECTGEKKSCCTGQTKPQG